MKSRRQELKSIVGEARSLADLYNRVASKMAMEDEVDTIEVFCEESDDAEFYAFLNDLEKGDVEDMFWEYLVEYKEEYNEF